MVAVSSRTDGAAFRGATARAASLRAAGGRIGLNDAYLRFLGLILVGYALMGKGFAYVGVPPVFIGEVALVLGFIVFLRTRSQLAVFATVPGLLLAIMMVWVLARTVPFLGQFGVDALRDSVLGAYGGFAFVIIALVLEDPRRLQAMQDFYSRFVGVFVPAVLITFPASHYLRESFPAWPGSGVPIMWVQSGEVAVNLLGVSCFLLAGLRRVPWYYLVFIVASLALVIPISRGAMLAYILPLGLAAVLLGRVRQMARLVALCCVAFGVVYGAESMLTQYREAANSEERSITAHQVVDNVASIFGIGRNEQTEGTKMWRLDWWHVIIRDTVYGPHFWLGRGFGLNLADADGFRPYPYAMIALRSPHNVFMTLLARTGVTGTVLWCVMMLWWLALLAHATYDARMRGERVWVGRFVFAACYGISAVINAAFDPALEGPMQGIWFWCVFGFGIAAVMVYRAGDKVGSAAAPAGTAMRGEQPWR